MKKECFDTPNKAGSSCRSGPVAFERLAEHVSARIEAFISKGTEVATRDDTDVIRRIRAFGLIVFALLSSAAGLVALSSEYRDVFRALLVVLVAVSVKRWVATLQGGRYARVSMHITLGLSLAVLTWGSVQLGPRTSTNVTIPSLLVLIVSYIVGVRAATCWTDAAKRERGSAIRFYSEPGS